MSSRLLFFIALSALCAGSDGLLRKTCHDVLPGCRIHSASVDPCTGNPRQCRIKRKEDHRLHVDFTPHFDAENLTLAMEHVRQNQTRTEIDACRFATCPMAARERQSLDLKFNFDNNIPSSKYNLKVKIFDPRDESKACCFTFKVSYVNP